MEKRMENKMKNNNENHAENKAENKDDKPTENLAEKTARNERGLFAATANSHPHPPRPFAIVVDTREQNPLRFPDGTPVTIGTCYPADYSVAGLRDRFAVERKGCTCNRGVWTSDLVGTITELLRGLRGDTERGSLRFAYELSAMSAIARSGGIAFVATDKPRSWYAEHSYFGGLSPSALFGAIRSLWATYGVPFAFFEDAREMSAAVLGLAVEAWKHANGLSSMAVRVSPSAPNCPAPFAKWARENAALIGAID